MLLKELTIKVKKKQKGQKMSKKLKMVYGMWVMNFRTLGSSSDENKDKEMKTKTLKENEMI